MRHCFDSVSAIGDSSQPGLRRVVPALLFRLNRCSNHDRGFLLDLLGDASQQLCVCGLLVFLGLAVVAVALALSSGSQMDSNA
jgi:hypothetical protein